MSRTARSALILIVEDDPNDVLFLVRAFKKANVRQALRVASDGQDAIEYLSGVGRYQDRTAFPLPCLVVLDLKMPRKNGLEVLRWLREHEEFKDLPVVMVTSSNHDGDRGTALSHGVEAFHVKPVSFDQLLALAGEIREEAEEHCKDAQPCPEQNNSCPSSKPK